MENIYEFVCSYRLGKTWKAIMENIYEFVCSYCLGKTLRILTGHQNLAHKLSYG